MPSLTRSSENNVRICSLSNEAVGWGVGGGGGSSHHYACVIVEMPVLFEL